MGLVNISSADTTASVIGGNIMSQLVGVWTADLIIDQINGQGFGPGTKVTITSENGYSRSGVVDPNRTGDRLDAINLRVLGGAGGMLNASTARSFVQPGAFVSDVLNALLADGGETLSTTTAASFTTTNLTAWSIVGGNTVSRNLKALLNIVAPTLSWRILADGTLWIGSETWPANSTTFDTLDFDPTDGSYHLGAQSPFIQPGQSLSGVGNVSRVLDVIADGKLRSSVWLDFPGNDRGVTDATQQIALNAFPGIDYFAMYACQVVAQSGDLSTVDLQPQGSRNQSLIGGLQRVPLRLMPGIKVQVTPGTTLLLGWDGGNPGSPFAALGIPGDTALQVNLAATQVQVQATAAASISGATLTASSSGPAVLKGSTTTLGNNPVVTPVLTVGAVDFMGIPITPAPTATGTVLAG